MNNKIIVPLVALLLLVNLSLIGFLLLNQPSKVVFVKSKYIFDNYVGMKEAQRVFEEKKSSWQSNLDTLKNDYQRAVSDFNLQENTLSKSEKESRISIRRHDEENIMKYAQQLEEQAAEEDHKLTEGIVNQIDAFIKIYAKENGFDLIVGTTSSGNVLYGADGIDVTEEILKALNEQYK